MKKSHLHKKGCGGLLDTLAQSRTGLDWQIVVGEGARIVDQSHLRVKAKRKIITQKMVLSLIDVATKKNRRDRVKTYWNTYHCQNRFITDNGKLYSKYCKNRFCTICLSIRKATIINKYTPFLQAWEDCHFVTLTVRSIPAKHLSKYFKGMLKVFSQIVSKHKKREKRGNGFSLVGIKSLECNFNPMRRTYNPHFHVIVRNKEMGEILVNEWLQKFTKKHALRCGQHIRKVKDTQRDLIELVKYGSKIFTEPNLKVKGNAKIFVSALDNILSAMHGRRIFERFGFNIHETRDKPSVSKLLFDYEKWTFEPKACDWINSETGECLSGYCLPDELKVILSNNIDLQLQ